MPYDLRFEPWIPMRRRSGRVEWAPPHMVADTASHDPVVTLAAPRPDFNGALTEFLIGLLTVAMNVDDEDGWRQCWHLPPTPEDLQKKLAALPNAFELDGAGPRFLQDLTSDDFAKCDIGPIEQILIDAPGDQTVSHNKDLFVKRAHVTQLGRPAAAMALLTLQTYAPSGGQGHRTSLRGGGPLTTVVEPRITTSDAQAAEPQPLWRMLWANAETTEEWYHRTGKLRSDLPQDRYPWLAATRTSNEKKNGVRTTTGDVHPLQCYFAMPRRIRLEFASSGICDLTGLPDTHRVSGFRMLPYGVKYDGWTHPLSPHYASKSSATPLPLHGQPGGVGWRDWLGLTLGTPDGSRQPAKVVAHFANRRAEALKLREFRTHAFGYDMDNMKPRDWTDAHLPVFAVDDESRRQTLTDAAYRLTNGTGIAASALMSAVERALFARVEDKGGDRSFIRLTLWEETSEAFFRVVRTVTDPSAAQGTADAPTLEFCAELERRAAAIFDRATPAAGMASDATRRLIAARFDLIMTLRGYSKLGAKLFESLGIPARSEARSTGNTTRRKREAKK